MFRFSALFLIAVATVAATVAVAQPAQVSSEGHKYALTCNANGYVMTSRNPVVRRVGSGAESHFVTGTETIYLGRSCDAFHATFGAGSWCWGNGGFVVELPGGRIGFPRQELYCPSADSLGLSCTC